jgi:hypothetical protein
LLKSDPTFIALLTPADLWVTSLIPEASKKWTMTIQNWRQAMSRFIIEFEDRLEKHIN